MLNITFLVGPAASGKSYLARQMMSMFREYRTISIHSSNKKTMYKVLKNQMLYDVLLIEEANKKMLRRLEYLVISYDNSYTDVITHMSTGVKKPNFNILICSQDTQVYRDFILFRKFNENAVNITIIECNYKSLF